MHLDTVLAQAGATSDPATGAVSTPIHLSATFRHPALRHSTGFDYSRTGNPTRTVLEQVITRVEEGHRGFAFASGMAAISAITALFKPGDHLIASDDLYGGTYRLFDTFVRENGIRTTYVDMSRPDELESAFLPATRGVFIETPTNPTMKITSLPDAISAAHRHGALAIVDNTFMTPFLQRPIGFGADIVVHSATKYLGGHNDLLAGLAVTRTAELSEQLAFVQNAVGAVLGPFDSWLLIRGMKTLGLRMERAEQNARTLAEWLANHPRVKRVYYPGLPAHAGHAVHRAQASGFGAMVSFCVGSVAAVERVINAVRTITFAESLGGVESLITYPALQTHADIPAEIRARIGITDDLLRLSVGIEHVDDLRADLEQALAS